MKKLFITLSIFVSAASFAGTPDPGPVNEEVKKTFKKEFPGASLINWTDAGDYFKAVFLYDGYRSEAYFTREGVLQGSARNIFYSQLPLAVTKAVEKRFTKPEVLEINELTSDNGTFYLIRLDDGTKSYRVQYDAGGNNVGFEKLKK